MTISMPGSVLLLHAWWGRTPFFLDFGDRLRAEGYRVEIPDLYGAGQTTDRIEEAEALAAAADEEQLFGRARAARAGLDPPVAVVAFSLGAPTAIRLAFTDPDVVAAVLYYGTGPAPADGTTNAAFLGHFGTRDPFEPVEDVRALERRLQTAEVPVTFNLYEGAQHWFAEPDRPEHDSAAAAAAWRSTLDFLGARLRAPAPPRSA
jgi:carboxymethylenebutenolidase